FDATRGVGHLDAVPWQLRCRPVTGEESLEKRDLTEGRGTPDGLRHYLVRTTKPDQFAQCAGPEYSEVLYVEFVQGGSTGDGASGNVTSAAHDAVVDVENPVEVGPVDVVEPSA